MINWPARNADHLSIRYWLSERQYGEQSIPPNRKPQHTRPQQKHIQHIPRLPRGCLAFAAKIQLFENSHSPLHMRNWYPSWGIPNFEETQWNPCDPYHSPLAHVPSHDHCWWTAAHHRHTRDRSMVENLPRSWRDLGTHGDPAGDPWGPRSPERQPHPRPRSAKTQQSQSAWLVLLGAFGFHPLGFWKGKANDKRTWNGVAPKKRSQWRRHVRSSNFIQIFLRGILPRQLRISVHFQVQVLFWALRGGCL